MGWDRKAGATELKLERGKKRDHPLPRRAARVSGMEQDGME